MKRKIVSLILFLLGLGLCSYPLVSNILSRIEQQRIIRTYEKEIKDSDAEALKENLADAKNYNKALYRVTDTAIGTELSDILSYDSYNQLLNIREDGIMGSIEIPDIDVDLPIYHGTAEEHLAVGVGHVYGTSLPIGGQNTHSLLTSHSGMPNAKLFTRLDELEIDDYFHITICNEKYTYKVCDIQVIKPEEVGTLGIKKGENRVSLITCTPYGINTHRLVVTGEQTDYTESVISNVDSLYHTMSLRELIFTILPFAFIAIAIIGGIKNRKGRIQNEKKK